MDSSPRLPAFVSPQQSLYPPPEEFARSAREVCTHRSLQTRHLNKSQLLHFGDQALPSGQSGSDKLRIKRVDATY